MLYEVLLGEWRVSWLIGLGLLTVCYFIIYLKTRIKTTSRPLLFILCVLVTYFTFGSPLAPISHLSFSLHMIQMGIAYFIIPPLFLLSIRPIFTWHTLNERGQSRCHHISILTLYLFAILFLVYHIPAILTLLTTYPSIRTAYAVILFLLAMVMWWPVTNPVFGKRLLIRSRQRYVFLSSLLIMPACLLFIISGFMSGMENPLLDEVSAALCFPGTAGSLEVLPAPFNTKYDQVASGFFMMGVHKFSLMFTVKFGER